MRATRKRVALFVVLSAAAGFGSRLEAQAAVPSQFYTLVPCRVFDSRNPTGAYGGPALGALGTRTLTLWNQCGASLTARALSINITVVNPASSGALILYPGGTTRPGVSSISYAAGLTRANNAMARLSATGTLSVYSTQPTGTVDFLIDVNGYYDSPANNQPPRVTPGPDQLVTFPASATVTGSATDDGLPTGSTLTYTWSKVSGPGTVTFGTPTATTTTVSADVAGAYVVQLAASDSQLTGFGLVTVAMAPPVLFNPPPDVVRFLEQSSFGPSDASLSRVTQLGLSAYLDEQFAAVDSGYPDLPGQPSTIPPTCDVTCQRDNYSMYPVQNRFFVNALYGPDQLRQRVAFALHKLFVVSGRDVTQPSQMTPYLQLLDSHAFGNFRQLLYDITLNPAMGTYLNMNTSTRTNPNENYAREILQLFSIGTEMLNLDGTVQVDGAGVPIPSYDQSIVTGFSKVFTGWTYAPQQIPGVTNYATPMPLTTANHDYGSKKLLSGVTLAAITPPVTQVTGMKDLNDALDNIFNHPNVGPLIATQLIHQLVSSNPSPAYVARVATVFNNNGSSVRGDLAAVVRTILLDPDARNLSPYPFDGHLREPVLFVTGLLRTFNVRAANGTGTSDGYLAPQTLPMDQDLFRPPSVFSYFSADYDLPGSPGFIGPEFGILSTSTSLRRANFVNTMAFSTIPVSSNAPNGTSIDLSTLRTISADPNGLVEQLNRVLLHGAISTQTRSSIVNAVSAVANTNPTLRAQTALYLVATSSQYQVQR